MLQAPLKSRTRASYTFKKKGMTEDEDNYVRVARKRVLDLGDVSGNP